MLSAKGIQRLLKSSRLHKFSAASKLHSLGNDKKPIKSSPNDTNLSRDQVIEIYDWIAQLNSQSKSA